MRPLTMQKGMVRANAIFTVWDDGVDTIYRDDTWRAPSA